MLWGIDVLLPLPLVPLAAAAAADAFAAFVRICPTLSSFVVSLFLDKK